jgi:SAM-dependent methyltransferase
MEPADLSWIAHRGRAIACPVDDDAVEALLGRVDLPVGAAFVDAGCGEAEWSIRLLERADAYGVGLDTSARALRSAAEQALGRLAPGRLNLYEQDAPTFRAPPGSLDAFLCVGSTHAYSGLAATLTAARDLLRPGGVALIGEGFWERPPSREALEGLGAASADDFRDLPDTIAAMEEQGFVALHAHVSSRREWDDYEWSWTGALERWVMANPGHPDADEVRTAARTHRDGYLRGYRGVLGFVTVLLASPPGGPGRPDPS